MDRDITLSVVAPVYNEEENLKEFVSRVVSVLGGLGIRYEIILVDDGSRDGSLRIATGLADENHSIKVVAFSRNFGHQAAITAGVDLAAGDAIVIIDSDLQDPPEVIRLMFDKWREGYDVVYGKRGSREGETPFKLASAKLFYRLLNRLSERPVPEDTGDFRLIDRKVAETFRKMTERHRFVRGMLSWVGFKQTSVLYDRKARFKGKSKYPLSKMLTFAADAITSGSFLPLRVMTLLGGFILAASVAVSLSFVLLRLTDGRPPITEKGLLAMVILMMGGLQLFATGVLGEYLGRIYSEAKGRPLYVIRELYPDPTRQDDPS